MNVLTRAADAAPAAAIAPNLPPFFAKPKNPLAAFLIFPRTPVAPSSIPATIFWLDSKV